jgi:hypothetical protein
MTSDALMTAQASSQALRLRSATASLVIADVPIANVDPDMGRRSTFLDFDDLALELITRTQLLHGSPF